eukprot:15470384-Alexandrium_andersonii.AAC.1
MYMFTLLRRLPRHAGSASPRDAHRVVLSSAQISQALSSSARLRWAPPSFAQAPPNTERLPQALPCSCRLHTTLQSQ